jgi:hypothetical protein
VTPAEAAELAEDAWIEVRYPLTIEQHQGGRGAWPWFRLGGQHLRS